MSNRATLDQLRAKHAWKSIERIQGKADSIGEEYAREVKRLPIRIRTSGLGQALGFLYAKSNGSSDAKALLLIDLSKWILNERKFTDQIQNPPPSNAILTAIIKGDAEILRRITDEVLRYLQWLGRFAEAEIKQDGEI